MRYALVLAILFAGCTTSPGSEPTVATVVSPPAGTTLQLVEVLTGLQQPLLYISVPGTEDMLVVEQGGRASLVRDGELVEPPFLDIADRIQSGGEQGFLGFAFPPDYADIGVAYASFTDKEGDDVVARYRLAAGTRDRLDPASEEILFDISDPYSNHNGGHIVFYDGHLWYGTGDGGGGGDPDDNGQDKDALLGSMLRVDVGASGPYTIPADNPFASDSGGAPEVWAKGLRNPWRFSFDELTGDLWIGDVGQNKWEEIDRVSAANVGLVNFGWNVYEGTHRYKLLGQPSSEVTMPVAEYARADGECAVTGGHVYRGAAFPALRGVYLFGDYCSGKIRSLRIADAGYAMAVELDTDLSISSFGEDAAGELYAIDHGGAIHRIVVG